MHWIHSYWDRVSIMNRSETFFTMVVVMIIGVFMMRGLGSKWR
ncbi:MAG TPA: hypothetical protein VMF30_12660 [Pirellulales bacterium]|nr:hypothetical protein [Pirellulales bacterium]